MAAGPLSLPQASVALAMPANDRLRLHEDERLLPTRPDPLQERPERAASPTQAGARGATVEDGQLLAQGRVLGREAGPGG